MLSDVFGAEVLIFFVLSFYLLFKEVDQQLAVLLVIVGGVMPAVGGQVWSRVTSNTRTADGKGSPRLPQSVDDDLADKRQHLHSSVVYRRAGDSSIRTRAIGLRLAPILRMSLCKCARI